jgi:hypothetical protein
MHHLESHFAVERDLAAQEYCSHAALSEYPEYFVPTQPRGMIAAAGSRFVRIVSRLGGDIIV